MLLPDLERTIVAPATPQGGGAIALIRLSGPDALKIAGAFLRPASAAASLKPRAVRLLRAEDRGRLLDRVMAVYYRAPASYTGEDMVELSCHGSPYIVSSLLRLAIAAGAREAGPGEFTMRAFLRGKLDLAQAEAVNDLIVSDGEAAHRAAITQAEGGVSDSVRKLRAVLVDLLSELEVRLDDPYGEFPPLDRDLFARRAAGAAQAVRSLADSFEQGRRARNGIRIAIAGAPNSGKSSLLNRLLGQDRAMVSPRAGTTRDTIEARTELGGFSVFLTDTAGIGQKAGDALEREGMRRSVEVLKTSDLVLWVLDGSRKNSSADENVGKAVARSAPPGSVLIKVYNKSDLPAARPAGETKGCPAVSCRTGAGMERLKEAMLEDEKRLFTAEGSSMITSARHYSALTAAHQELSALGTVTAARPAAMELAAEHLRGALSSLSGILGETTPEDVLANIFRNFCVGK